MTADENEEGACRDLEVHTRRIVGSDVKDVRSVPCPRRGHSVPLATCLGCEHFIDVSLQHAERPSFLRCVVENVPGDVNGLTSDEPDRTSVFSIMRRVLVCVRPDLDLDALMRLFVEHGINAAPVVDDANRAVGIVSKTDLLRFKHEEGGSLTEEMSMDWLSPEQGFHLEPIPAGKVMDIMTPVPFMLPENASLARAAALMVFEGVHQIPIVGVDQEVVGMISSLDILRWFACKAGYVIARS